LSLFYILYSSENNRSVTEGIKNTAGAPFNTVQNALETTENAAKSAVEGTAKAVKNVTGNQNGQ
jgi:phage-related protein